MKDCNGKPIERTDTLELKLPDHHPGSAVLNHRTVRIGKTVGEGTQHPTFKVRTKDPVVKEYLGHVYIPFAWTQVVPPPVIST